MRVAHTGFATGLIPSSATIDNWLYSSASGTITSSVTPRGVGYAYAVPYTGSSIELHYNTPIGAGQVDTFHRAEFGFDVSGGSPPANCSIFGLYDGTNVAFVHWRTDNKLQFTDFGGTVTIDPSGTTISSAVWYRMEIRLRNGTTTSNGQWEIKVYDVATDTLVTSFSSSAANVSTTTYRPYWGNSNSNTAAGVTLYLANIALNDSSGSDQNSWCGPGQIVHVLPDSDSAVGSGWQKPGGATTSLNTSLDNVPPTPPNGDSTSAGDAETMVRNATSTTTSNLDETLKSYTAAGIGASDTITLLQPFAWMRRAGATAQSPALELVSNPAVASATATVLGTTGTFPTNWTQRTLAIQYAPTVTKGTGPVLRVGKRTATTQALLVASMGLLVEYVPSTASPQTISPIGIASSEAFGLATITVGPVTLNPVGITSDEAFGLPTIQPGPITITAVGIPSDEAFGLPTVTIGAATINPIGIASAEAFGLATITTGPISRTAIGIPSDEAFGLPTITPGPITRTAIGIASAEAFGLPTVTVGVATFSPIGIPSSEAFGNPTITFGPITRTVIGIPSEEAFGLPTITYTDVRYPIGIPSEEAFGLPRINQTIYAEGIASAEAFGTPVVKVNQVISLSGQGIASAEAVGRPTVTAGALVIHPASIPSAEAFGLPNLAMGGITISPVGIASAQAFGLPTIIKVALTRGPLITRGILIAPQYHTRADRHWKFVLANSSDMSAIGEMRNINARNLDLMLNGAGQFQGSMHLLDDLAGELEPLRTCVIAYCDDINGVAVPRWSGPVWSAPKNAGSDNRIPISAVGWRTLLDYRELREAMVFDTLDTTTIIQRLLATANNTIVNGQTPENFVTNGSFEKDLTGWTQTVAPTAVVVNNVWSSHGPKSVQITSTNLFVGGTYFNDNVLNGATHHTCAVTGSTQYTLSADINGIAFSGANAMAGVYVEFYDSSNVLININGGAGIMGSAQLGPRKSTRTMTSPSNAAYARVCIIADSGGGSANAQARFDNVAFVQGASVGFRSTYMTPGAEPAAQDVTRSYDIGQKIGPAITDLINIEAGPDTSVDPITRVFDTHYDLIKGTIYGLGVDRPEVVWGYNWGPKNLQNFSELGDTSRMANRLNARSPYGTGMAQDIASMDYYGALMEDSVSLSDVTDVNILAKFAGAEVAYRLRPLKTYEMVPFPYDGTERVPALFWDYDFGDITYATAKYGALDVENQAMRIFGATIEIDDNGIERITSLKTVYS